MKKIFNSFLVIFLLFSVGYGIKLYNLDEGDILAFQTSKANTLQDAFGNVDISDIKDDKTTILLLGVDSIDKTSSGIRTDTIMLFTIDGENKKASLISIPRDSRVHIPVKDKYDKINHAHSYGGVDLTKDTIEEFLEIDIDYYLKIDYNALYKTVNDVGGVEVDVPIDMKYDGWIDLKKGRQVLNGDKAMQYLRFRKGYINQDLGRIEAQQQFLDALIKKVVSPASIFRIPNYIDTLYNYVDTDMTKGDMLKLAFLFTKFDVSELKRGTVPGVPEMIDGISYYGIDDDEKEKFLNEYYYNETPEDGDWEY